MTSIKVSAIFDIDQPRTFGVYADRAKIANWHQATRLIGWVDKSSRSAIQR